MDKAISKGHLIVEINYTTTANPLPCSMDEYNKMKEASKVSTLPFVAVRKHSLNNSTVALENLSQVDNDSGQFDKFNEADNNKAMNEDDCNNNCITQETLDDLPLTQEKFHLKKIEKLNLFAKSPQVLVQWVNYEVPNWEPLVLTFSQMANDISCCMKLQLTR
eukprot:8279905-Ditylum_brightwellii.AAC.1